MVTSNKGIDLIKRFEGCKLNAYLCPAKIPTIGYGNTFYEDGTPVKIGDTITQERATELLKNLLVKFESYVNKYVKSTITQEQYDALVSFCYNIGAGNLAKSTLLKKVNLNPKDATIRDEFMKWNKAGGKELLGLTRRRKAEADLYFNVGAIV